MVAVGELVNAGNDIKSPGQYGFSEICDITGEGFTVIVKNAVSLQPLRFEIIVKLLTIGIPELF